VKFEGFAVTPTTVVFVLWQGLNVISGVTTWVCSLQPHLVRRGFDVRILVFDPSPADAVLGQPDGVFVSLRQLEERIACYSPAVAVLMSVGWQSSFAPVLASLNRRGKSFYMISVVHSDSYDDGYRSVPTFAPWVNHFICVSPTVAQHTLGALDQGSRPGITTLPYGVDCPDNLARDYSTSPIRLVYAGRLIQHQKRVLDFVELVHQLGQHRVDFRLDLFGAGPDEQQLRQRLARHVAQGQVSFQGARPHHKLLAALQEYDVFVNLSEFEGTSVAMLEAMAAGCVPVVTEASSGVTEVVECGVNGFYVPVGAMSALAACIAELAQSRAMLAQLGQQAHCTVQNQFSLSQYADRFVALVEEIAHQPLIKTSKDAEQVLDCVLPIEENVMVQLQTLWHLSQRLAPRLSALEGNVAIRFGQPTTQALRWIKRSVRAAMGKKD
jgi:glycosyltransferase involved in cell wall biosynthesis